MKYDKGKGSGFIKLFGIPVILILLGLGVIGYTSTLAQEQDKHIEKWSEITATVVAKGDNINTGYDFGVELTEETIKDKTYHVRYRNKNNRNIDCLYDCKIQKLDVDTEARFLVDPDNSRSLWLLYPDWVFIVENVIGGMLIIFGFLSCSSGLRSVSKNMGD